MPVVSKVSSTATSSTLESYALTPTSSLHLDPVDRLTRVPFKRVVFALDTLAEEPQQQIPSRVPKKGDVIIPEDLNAPPPRLTMGIHTTPPPSSETNATSNAAPVDPQAAKLAEERLMREAIERQKMSLIQSRKHANEAHAAAVRIAKEVANYKKSKNSKNKEEEDQEEEEEKANWDMQNHSFADFSGGDIDTPLHEHVDYFNNGNDQESSKWDNQDDDVVVVEDLPLDQLYTRCCHVREILPIPATIKQLRRKTKPLNVLKMLNPKPTLIDILSFSDFLAIAPIITVIFDNVTMDSYQLNIVLVSLSVSKTIEKLSLRNVPIEAAGWESLCRFVTKSKSLTKLDISQQKTKADLPLSFFRSQMDWDLFTEALILRGGLQELVINGCKLTTSQFKKLVYKGLSISTLRLGVASTDLDFEKSTILANWISSPNNTCIGVDIGFNDLKNGHQLSAFNSVFKTKSEHVKLAFFSLNSTNVTVAECNEVIEALSHVKTLRFLDLGNDPQLFPGILPTLDKYLPKYPELRRLHFECDELSSPALHRLNLLCQNCPKLVHVSLLGNSNITPSVSASLYSTVKSTGIYNLDVDYDSIPEELSSKIAFYLMRNLERFLNNNTNHTDQQHNADEDLIFDGSLITKAAEKLLEDTELHDDATDKAIFVESLVHRTIRLRMEIHGTMDKLFKDREEGKLSLEGKETLLRFCLLDDSLESIIHIFSEVHEDAIEDKQVNEQQPGSAPMSKSNSETHHRPHLMRELSSQLPIHKDADLMFTGPIVSPAQSHGSDYFGGADRAPEHAPETETAPHNVVSDDNFSPIDHLTGKPVFMRRSSTTSLHARKIEEEEGEFHRWGFFVQQQNHIMPDSNEANNGNADRLQHPTNKHLHSQTTPMKPSLSGSTSTTMTASTLTSQSTLGNQSFQTQQSQSTLALSKPAIIAPTQSRFELKIKTIPSGPQLREAVIKAKGIKSVSDLITKVNKNMNNINTIYNGEQVPETVDIEPSSSSGSTMTTATTTVTTASNNGISASANIASPAPIKATSGLKTGGNVDLVADERPSSPLSIDEEYYDGEEGDVDQHVVHGKRADAVYEKILDDVVKVRSNRSIGSNNN
ncbi:unnamed protein product [Ambrosiozyma monospora]|uniref:Unnamed protein product n=1 Tax=Ambrosiozyma monospora TaxID=43982 RepID=A0A9W7DE07_AMBMO|nr:unnamed protein product [Ambrosiozyma monospora]